MEREVIKIPAPPRLPTGEARLIAEAAMVIMLGQVASRVLGLVRETVISHLFGASGLVSAFRTAAIVPTIVYDLLIGGMISAALVPVFSDYVHPERRQELERLASAVFGLAIGALLLVIFLLELAAPLIAWLLGGGLGASLQEETIRLMRIMLPAIFFFGLSGLSTGLLYANKRFLYPAFGAAVFNAGIIIVVLALSPLMGIRALCWGVVVGAILQLAIQIPGLRGLRLSLTPLWHPEIRRMGLLYAPVILGIVVSQVGTAIDYNLASRTGEQSRAWMQAATYLIQFPLGLVATATSFAVLPSLSQFATAEDMARFRRTLATGLRIVLVLILPAAAGLLALATPIIALIFEHGAFQPYDTLHTAQALRWYLLGLPFAAIDQPLIFAFYARKDTKTPVLVGVFSVLVYLIVALATIRPMGMIGLVFANSVQWASHALVMLVLAHRRLGLLRGQGLLLALSKALLASTVMALMAYGTAKGLEAFVGRGLLGEPLIVIGAGGVGFLTYTLLIVVLRSEEASLVIDLVKGLRQGRRLQFDVTFEGK
ncbi:MAG: murein biosynthesis integral membrane protein MurJ [Anaerolineae bacterium]|nr:murein biosynthesis integral membrane protein MurJ [Anaerolineae bacterium]